MTISEMIEVLQHSKNGGVVEYKNKNSDTNIWTIRLLDIWDFVTYDYRIKPEPKRVPLDYNDMLVGKCVIEKGRNTRRMIVSQANDSVLLSENVLGEGTEWHYYDNLMKYFTFADGTPCSKESECE
jgi:hypothetical protein